MKKQYNVFWVIWVWALVFSGSVLGQEATKTKQISEKYTLSSADKFEVTNKYGKVHINTYDGKELSVEIQMKAWAKNDNKAQELLDRISIRYGKTGDVVSFETEISQGNVNISSNSGFEINYTVNMPKSNDLRVENKYGNTFLADFNGNLDLEAKYGNLKAQKLMGSSKKIEVKYGNFDIAEIEKGDLDIAYSNGSIGRATDLDLRNSYGNVNIDYVKNVDFETKYGGFVVEEEAENIKGVVKYSKFEVEKLRNSLVLEVEYAGSFRVRQVSNKFTKIDITGKYSSFNLEFEKSANFDFNILTRYGNFSNGLPNVKISKQIEQNQSSQYEGKVGNGGGAVRIEAGYGSVKFKERL